MCKKSSCLFQGYVSKLLSTSIRDATRENFTNTELYVKVEKKRIPIPRKKRMGKGQRCAAIHKLLSGGILREKYKSRSVSNPEDECPRGGLKDLLSFTESYDFGYSSRRKPNTPLDKLIEFSENFFCGISNYKNTIMEILGKRDCFDFEDESEDEMFRRENWSENIPISNDCIKREFIEDGMDYEDPSSFVQVCYDETNKDYKDSLENNNNEDALEQNYIFNVRLQDRVAEENKSELNFLSDLMRKVNTDYFILKRSKNINDSYINPKLQKQFFNCNFKCNACNRRFKTYGYLKAHTSKVHCFVK